jgi:exonuclease VII large subunit
MNMTKAVKERRVQSAQRFAFREARAMFQENRELIREIAERQKEADRQFKENAEMRHKEMERLFRETRKQFREANERWDKLERIVDKNGEQLGGLGNDLGALAENMVGPEIAKRFNELDYHFDLVGTKGCKITDKDGKTKTQVDVLLENGETVIAVEVKLKPLEKHIEHHIKQLKILKENWISILKRNKKFMGGIAGAIWDETMKDAVHDAGLFVIEQSGDTMRIDMPEGWTPAVF